MASMCQWLEANCSDLANLVNEAKAKVDVSAGNHVLACAVCGQGILFHKSMAEFLLIRKCQGILIGLVSGDPDCLPR